ncbi:MAG TPA: hypothetical protein VG937_15015 [Polyangiaceae bacterium]|nr:hypothetical protein [Polyangiaceae bacterium]
MLAENSLVEAAPRAPAESPVSRAIDWTLFAIALLAITAIPKSVSGDGRLRYEVLDQFLNTGVLSSPKYSTLGPLISSPLYLLGRAFGAAKAFTSYFNALLFLLALAFIGREFKKDLPATTRRLLLVLLVFGSMFAHHVQRYYSEVFTSILVTIGVCYLSRDHKLRGWAAIVLGAVNTPAALLGVGAVAIVHARKVRAAWPLLAPLVTFALLRLESWLVRGSVLLSGYDYDSGFRGDLPYAGLPNFSYPFFFGLLAIFLSFGKGLVFFTPGLFLPLPAATPARVRWIHGALLAFVVGLVLVYAKWWSWYGGWFWGPRFFLIASVPASLSLACNLANWQSASVARRVMIALVLTLSFWVGVNGLAFQSAGLDLCIENYYRLQPFCLFVPEMSVLWHPFVDGAASHPPLFRAAAFVATAFWALSLAWFGRALYADLWHQALRALSRARAWW